MLMKRYFLLLIALMPLVLMSVQCNDVVDEILVKESKDPMSAVIDGVLYKTNKPVQHVLIGFPRYPYWVYDESADERFKGTWRMDIVSRVLYSDDGGAYEVIMTLKGKGKPEKKTYYEASDEVDFILRGRQGDVFYEFHSKDAWLEITDLEFVGDDCRISARFGFTGVGVPVLTETTSTDDVSADKEIVLTDGVFEDYEFRRSTSWTQ